MSLSKCFQTNTLLKDESLKLSDTEKKEAALLASRLFLDASKTSHPIERLDAERQAVEQMIGMASKERQQVSDLVREVTGKPFTQDNNLDYTTNTEGRKEYALTKEGKNFTGRNVNFLHVINIDGIDTYKVADPEFGEVYGSISFTLDKDGYPAVLNWIHSDTKGIGDGRRILRAALATSKGDLLINNMLIDATEFWQHMGATLNEGYDKWEHGNATLNYEVYDTKRRSGQKNAGVRYENGGRSNESQSRRKAGEDIPGVAEAYPRTETDSARLDQNEAGGQYEIPAKISRDMPAAGAELTVLRREAASLDQPSRGITLYVTDDGKALATGPAGKKVPDKYRKFAKENGLTLVVRRRQAISDKGNVATGSAGQKIYTPAAGSFAEKPMPIAYRESGALYFGEMGNNHIQGESDNRFSQSATPARNPFTLSTLTAAIDKAMGQGFTKLLELTGKFKIISSADIGKYLGVGARFSFAGQRAQTTDAHSLETAQNRLNEIHQKVMAGVLPSDSADTVRKETGWYKGVDGKWRFEISDRDATLKQANWDKLSNELRINHNDKKSYALSNLLDHPKLFAAYPFLKSSRVFVQEGKTSTHTPDGQGTGQFIIGIRDPDYILSALMHEIQHAIQDHENFAVGTNPDFVLQNLRKNNPELVRAYERTGEVDRLAYDRYQRHAGEIEAREVQKRMPLSDESRKNKIPTGTSYNAPPDIIVVFNDDEMANAPTPVNSSIAQDQTDTPAFRKWFGSSAVVDADGKPLVVYHGTKSDISTFERNKPLNVSVWKDSQGHYFTKHIDVANAYTVARHEWQKTEGANIVPVYLSIKNPLYVDGSTFEHAYITPDNLSEYREQGYDGIIVRDGDEYIIFDSAQAKSSIGNNGDFSPTNPDIRYSKDGRVLAFVRGSETFLVADNISSTDDNVKGLLTHEIALHALSLGRSEPEFQAILKQFTMMGKTGNEKVKAAQARVPADTPAHLVEEESLGYYLEAHPDTTFAQKVIAWFKAQIRKLGASIKGSDKIKFFQWANKLTQEDIVSMASQALHSAPQTLATARDRGTFLAGASDKLYSQLRVAIRDMNDKIFQGSAANVKLHLMNNLGKYGIKRDELFWTGLEDYLNMPGKVSKADVLAFLDENAVQVKDVVLGERGGKDAAKEIDRQFKNTEYNDTKFPTQVLPGGRDYKELLITLPTSKAENRSSPEMQKAAAEYYGEKYVSGLSDAQWELVARKAQGTLGKEFVSSHYPDAKNLIAHVRLNARDDAQGRVGTFLEEQQSDWGIAGSKDGFSPTAGLSSAEEAERIALNKKLNNRSEMTHTERMRALELSNKWAESLSKRTTPAAPFVSTLQTAAVSKNKNAGKFDVTYGSEEKEIDGKKKTVPKVISSHDTEAEAKVAADKLTAQKNMQGSTAHTLLSLKKVILHAIEQGHSFVSWTTGTQQKERYKLSNKINSAHAIANKDGTYNLTIEDISGNEIKEYSGSGKKVTASEMEDVVGKDLTKKLTEGANANKYKPWPKNAKSNPAFFSVRGLDLDIGGEWADTLYGDENGLDANGKPSLMSQAVKEVARQLGIELKVGPVNLGSHQDRVSALAARRRELAPHSPEWNRANDEYTKILDKHMDNGMQPGFTITPELRSKVNSAGMPLFSKSAPIKERWAKLADTLIYNMVDKFHGLKKLEERSPSQREESDAMLAQELYAGNARARTDDFHQDMKEPLIKAIHDEGLGYDEVEEYLWAKRAYWYNKVMRERNPNKEELDALKQDAMDTKAGLENAEPLLEYFTLKKQFRDVKDEVSYGQADESAVSVVEENIAKLRKDEPVVNEYLDAVEKIAALNKIKPYEGDNTALSGMSNQDAQDVIDKARKDGKHSKLEKIAQKVYEITGATRELMAISGLISKEQSGAWVSGDIGKFYVPLHRDEVGEDMPMVGMGFNVRGKESKHATGSEKEVTNILAHVMAKMEATIIRAEKVKVDRAMREYLLENPNNDIGQVDIAPMIPDLDKSTGLVVERVDPTYKNQANVLTFKIDGKEHTITFNKNNLEAMRMAQAFKNLSATELGEVTATVGRATRFLATMNTSANPVFTFTNFLRDIGTAFVNLSDTELAKTKFEVFKAIPSAIKGVWDMLQGKTDTEMAKAAREFRDAGGQMGHMDHYKDITQRATSLRTELERMGPGAKRMALRTARSYWDLIENTNMAVENGVRLASYVAARKRGMTAAKSASLAKNLTVNFDRKGEKSAEFNMWYMFANASIQGSARMIKALKNSDVQKVVGGIVIAGFVMDILARSMADDDDDDGKNDYDQIAEYIKAHKMIFMVDGKPFTLPMPYGYSFFHTLGRKMSEAAFRKDFKASQGAFDIFSSAIDAFNPLGQTATLAQAISPTVTDPIVAWAENKNWTGAPLRKEQSPFGIEKPEYQMAYKSVSAPALWLAKKLNDIDGNAVRPGTINVNPALFDFAITTVLGGAGRTYLQAVTLPIKVASGDEVQNKEIPFANIFIGSKSEHHVEKSFYDAAKAIETTVAERKLFAGDQKQMEELRKEHGSELRMATTMKITENMLKHIKEKENAIEQSKRSDKREMLKKLEDKKTEIMIKFNRKYQEMHP